jgi:hypothetical protein
MYEAGEDWGKYKPDLEVVTKENKLGLQIN